MITVKPDGQPQSSIVWYDYDGELLHVDSTLGRQKGKNLLANAKVSPLIVDAEDIGRYIQI